MKSSKRQSFSGLMMLWLFAAALLASPFQSVADDTPTANSSSRLKVLRGRASWYGREHQGKRTSSGVRFDRFKYTCAHKTLPFGTKLRVTNPDNGKSVVVVVNDRGPFRNQRIIDLSEIAARPLDIVRKGVTGVVAEIMPEDTPVGPVAGTVELPEEVAADEPADATSSILNTPEPAETFVVQAGTFGDPTNAAALRQRIEALDKGLTVAVQPVTAAGRTVSRVLVGNGLDRPAAEQLRKRLQQQGITGMVRQAENL